MKGEDQIRDLGIPSELRDQDGGIKEIARQEWRSALRPLRTHFAAAAFVRQCLYEWPLAIPLVARRASSSSSRASFSRAASSRNRLRLRCPTLRSIAFSTASDITTCVRAKTIAS